MILLADSGSTKTDWVILQPDGQHTYFESLGLNPFLVSEDEFKGIVADTFVAETGQISTLYFYGAGCTPSMKSKVKIMLESVFTKADIHVQSDLVSAARALFRHKPGITAILGTGSIVGMYNGRDIDKTIPSLGYVLGDEGSGNALGKMLLRDYLRKTMPAEMSDQFALKYNLSMDKVLHSVYKESAANRYLAQFTTFLSAHITNPYCENLVIKNFDRFVKNCILFAPNVRNLPIGFVGSIAHVFSKQLKEVLKENGISSCTILKAPIHHLVDYHMHVLKKEQD